MIRSRPFALALAALLGGGLGAAALSMLPRDVAPSAAEVEQAAEALRKATSDGLPDGRWRIVEPMWTRERLLARDPVRPGVVQVLLPERADGAVLPAAVRDLTRHLLGDVEQFLRAYRVTAGPVVEGSGSGRSVSYEWTKPGVAGAPTRRVWFEASTGKVLRVIERDARGDVLRSLELVGRDLGGWAPRPVPAAIVRQLALARESVPDFHDFVARVPVPVYEPAALPPKFHRSDWGYDDRPPKGDAAAGPLPLAWIAYTDGVVRMNLFVARPDQMRRLEALARQQDNAAGRSGCPTTGADTPQELVEEAGSILVHRRDDGCRVVLRRDDLPDVAVALVGYRGLAPDDYVRTVRTLVRVVPPTPRPGEVPLHPADGR